MTGKKHLVVLYAFYVHDDTHILFGWLVPVWSVDAGVVQRQIKYNRILRDLLIVDILMFLVKAQMYLLYNYYFTKFSDYMSPSKIILRCQLLCPVYCFMG